MPAILITGASTGIGEACAHHLDALGHRVFAGVRKPEDGERLAASSSDRLTPVIVDVTDADSIAAARERIEASLGTTRFAGIVNNAGVARGGPVEFLAIDEWREQLEVNLVGQVAVTQAFLPLVRSGCGRIVFIGSIAGRVATPLMGPYCASKFAIEAVAETLRHELARWDLKVVCVEPGVVKTPIWAKGKETVARLERDADPATFQLYADLVDAVASNIDRNDRGGVAADTVAKVVEKALFAEHPKARYLVGPDAQVAGLMARFLPDSVRDKLVRSFA